jgi:RHS repeat-associated protein
MSMPGRKHSGGTYRYGFNGKETDSETGIQDYGMRWYLPNIARFASVDPLTAKYTWLTPYQFAANRPIDGTDLDGLEWSEKITNYANGWKRIEFHIYIKVINSSKIVKEAEIKTAADTKWKQAIEKTYSKTDEQNKIDYEVGSVQFVYVTAADVNKDTDFYIEVIDVESKKNKEGQSVFVEGEATGGIGNSNVNRITIAGAADGKSNLNSVSLGRTVAHELGHTAGLEHPHKPTNAPPDDPTLIKYDNGNGTINNNVMIWGSRGGRGFGATMEQLKKITGVIAKNNPLIIERERTNSGNTGIIKYRRSPNPKVEENNSKENYEPKKNKEKVD